MHAIVERGDFERLENLFAPDVRFRALIPAEYRDASTAAGARALLEDWFGEKISRELLGWPSSPSATGSCSATASG